MKNKTISLGNKGFSWFLKELKDLSILRDTHLTMPLIRVLQCLFFSFSETDDALTGTQLYSEVYDVNKIMDFMNAHGHGLDAMQKLSEELKLNPKGFYKKNYDISIARQIEEVIGQTSRLTRYSAGLELFFNICRSNQKENKEFMAFVMKMYQKIDNELTSSGLNDELMWTLPSFASFFRDQEYVPKTLTVHWKYIINFIKEHGNVFMHTNEMICVLSDLILQNHRVMSKEQFEELNKVMVDASRHLLIDNDYSEVKNINQDSLLLLCFLHLSMSSRNDDFDYATIYAKPIEHIRKYLDTLQSITKVSIEALKDLKDPLIAKFNINRGNQDSSEPWMYPLVTQRLREYREAGVTHNNLAQVQFVTSIKNALQFNIFYQQLLVLFNIKIGMKALIQTDSGVIDLPMIAADAYRQNYSWSVQYIPQSPLAELDIVNTISDASLERFNDFPDQQFLFVLRMLLLQAYHKPEKIGKMLDKIAQMQHIYQVLFNEYVYHMVDSFDFNKSKMPFLYELLIHPLTNKETKLAIIKKLVSLDTKSSHPFHTALKHLFILGDFEKNIEHFTINELIAIKGDLVSCKKKKPFTILKNLYAHLPEAESSKLIMDVWNMLDNRVISIDTELTYRAEQKKLIEAQRLAKIEEARLALENVTRLETEKAEAIRIFREKLQPIKEFLEAKTPNMDVLTRFNEEMAREWSVDSSKELTDQIVDIRARISTLRAYIPILKSSKSAVEDFGLKALELSEKFEQPSNEGLHAIVLEVLGSTFVDIKSVLDARVVKCEEYSQQIDVASRNAQTIINQLHKLLEEVNQKITDARIQKAQDAKRIQMEENAAAEALLTAQIEELERQIEAEIIQTSQLVVKFVEQKAKSLKEGKDLLSELDKELATLKNDFNPVLVGNVTITPEEYEGPLKEVLKHIQTKRTNGNTHINFVFNNYILSGVLDTNGALTLESIPSQLTDNHLLLESILNKIALTLIIGKDKTKEFPLRNPVTKKTILATEKSKAHRLNSANMLFKHYEGQYYLSLDGITMIEDIDKKRELILSADYFIKEPGENCTILIPIIATNHEALVKELETAIELYGADNVVHISLTGHHRRRMTSKVETEKPTEEVELQKNDSVVPEATIRRYLSTYQGLLDVVSQQDYINKIILGEKRDPYLFRDNDHPQGVSFGHTEVLNSKGMNRVAYTFVRDSVRLLTIEP